MSTITAHDPITPDECAEQIRLTGSCEHGPAYPAATVIHPDDAAAILRAFSNMPYGVNAYTVLNGRGVTMTTVISALNTLAADLSSHAERATENERQLTKLQNDRDAVRRFFGTDEL